MTDDTGGWPDDPLSAHGDPLGGPADGGAVDPAGDHAGFGDHHDHHDYDASGDGITGADHGYPEHGYPDHGYSHHGYPGDDGHGDRRFVQPTDGSGDPAHQSAHEPGHGQADRAVHGSGHTGGPDHGPDEYADHYDSDSVDHYDNDYEHHDDGGAGSETDARHGLAQPVDAATFPPSLDLDVTPSDGREWVDVDLLADPGSPAAGGDLVVPDSPQALLADLHQADGGDGAPSWSAVGGSDDPAVRALALRWQAH